MKIDMHYTKPHKFIRGPLVGLCSLLSLSLIGCDGGLIGTGSGPDESVYELENLPERISPDVPKTLFRGEELPPPDNLNEKNKEVSALRRSDDEGSDKSEGWQAFTGDISTWSSLRLGIEINATIVDLAFDDIVNECAEQLINCTIPLDRIRVTITQDVVNRLINLATEWEERTPLEYYDNYPGGDNIAEKIKTHLKSLLDVDVVLGITHYSKLDGAPYSHDITTFLKWGPILDDDLRVITWCCLSNVDFSVRWHEDGDVAKFSTVNIDQVTHDYFYQNNVPGELAVTHRAGEHLERSSHETNVKILSSDVDQAGILLETASLDSFVAVAGPVLQPDGEYLEPYELFNQGFTVNQAQMDNRGGYSTYYSRYLDQDQNVTILRIYRESFDQIGRLLAGVRCVFDVFDRTPENCDENALETIGPEGSSITDSIHYFAPGEFDSLVAIQDAIRWTVEGVPTDTRGIAVISAQSQSDLSTSEVLCRGVQDDKEETYLFCMATDEQLDNTVVVEVNKGMLTKIIPGAKLVQIQ